MKIATNFPYRFSRFSIILQTAGWRGVAPFLRIRYRFLPRTKPISFLENSTDSHLLQHPLFLGAEAPGISLENFPLRAYA